MTTAESIEPDKMDAELVLRATVDTGDEIGALRFEVAVWTRSYGPYLRYVLRADRASGESSWHHPFSRLGDDRDGSVQVENIVADNEATRALLRLIALPDPELARVSGNSGGPANY